MDEEVTEENVRNWIKSCLAIKHVTAVILHVVKEMSLVQFHTNAAELQRHIGNVATGCTACDHKTVRPFHAAAGECIFRQRSSQCNCTKDNTIQCPSRGICGLLYDLLTRDHVMQDPTWSNVNFERLCNSPCEQIKCYISKPGYRDVSAFEKLDVTAMIQICTTNKSLKYTLDEHDTRILNQILDDHYKILCTSCSISSEDYKKFMSNFKSLLQHEVYRDIPFVSSNAAKLESLEHDNVVITRAEEIVAIEQALQAIREASATLEQGLEQSIREASATLEQGLEQSIREASATLEQGLEQSSDNVEVKRNKLQQLKRMETKQKLTLKQRTEYLQDVCSKTQVFLREHSLLMGSDASMQCTIAARSENTYTRLLSESIDDNVRTLMLDQQSSERRIEDVKNDTENILLSIWQMHTLIMTRSVSSTIQTPDLKITINVTDTSENEAVSEWLVEATNGIVRNFIPSQEHIRQLQALLTPVLDALTDGGNIVRDVRNECLAIYIECATLENWIKLCMECLDGTMTKRFKAVEDFLRKDRNQEQLAVRVDIYEKDFVRCADYILTQIKKARDEIKKTPSTTRRISINVDPSILMNSRQLSDSQHGDVINTDNQITITGLRNLSACVVDRNNQTAVQGILPLSDNIIIIWYFLHKRVKLLDVTRSKEIFSISVPRNPWDMCLIGKEEAAITYPYSCQIQIIGINTDNENKFVLKNRITVCCPCREIVCTDNKFFVSCQNGDKIYIFTKMGQLENTLTCGVNTTVCRFVVLGDSIYVSDDNNNRVCTLTMSGKLLRTFCNPDLIGPSGMTVLDTRQLIVCGRNSNNLVLLNTHTGETRELYGELDGIKNPSRVSFKLEGSKLFVLPDYSNVISVYQVILDAHE